MLGAGFFGNPVPLAGRRRQVGSMVTRLVEPKLDRLPDGRYMQTNWMHNRCANLVQVGATTVYVVNDYGVMVPVESWEARC